LNQIIFIFDLTCSSRQGFQTITGLSKLYHCKSKIKTGKNHWKCSFIVDESMSKVLKKLWGKFNFKSVLYKFPMFHPRLVLYCTRLY